MQKLVLVDICNGLLDSRHRQYESFFFFGLIYEDAANYTVIRLLKLLQKHGYRPVFFMYANIRYKSVVIDILKRHGFIEKDYDLYLDVAYNFVYNPVSLKKYVCDKLINIDEQDVLLAIDKDPESILYYKSHDIEVLQPTLI